MNDREATMLWLFAQAKGVPNDPDNLASDLLPPEEVKARVAQAKADGIGLSSDLAWDLADWAVTEWFERKTSDLFPLNEYQRINCMRLAVELADSSALENSVWLALAANAVYLIEAPGLAEACIQDLVERLSNRRGDSFTLTGIKDTLSSLDSLLGSLDDWRRESAVVVATYLIAQLARYSHEADVPALREPPGHTVSRRTIMAEWVIEHANHVIMSETSSEISKCLAFEISHRALHADIDRQLGNRQVDESSFWAMADQRASAIAQPNLTDPSLEQKPSQSYVTLAYALARKCAEILIDDNRPAAALSNISSAHQRLFGSHQEPPQNFDVAFTCATAYAALGDLRPAISELETWRSFASTPYRLATFLWAVGRLQCETGDMGGLCSLKCAVALAVPFLFRGEQPRMVLLLAEKEVELGHSDTAICLLQDSDYSEIPWFFTHARVILGEAYLALARDEGKPDSEQLDTAESIFLELGPDTISDTPDSIRPRILAALGEIALLKGDTSKAREYLRSAMGELDRWVVASWRGSGSILGTEYSPDDAPVGYWRRPWNRNWGYAAELSLVAELSDDPEGEAAFAQLQRYRRFCHADTVAELAGFVPETSLSPERRELLDELRGGLGRVNVEIANLSMEYQQIDEAPTTMPTDSQDQCFLERRDTVVWAWHEKVEERKRLKKRIEEIEKEVVAWRGYLAQTGNLVEPPKLPRIKDRLASADAAVIELVRVNGAQWGLDTSWFAFVVTPEGEGVDLIPLLDPRIDSDLRALRNDRFALNQPALAKLSEAILLHIPHRVFKRRNIFIAADGDAWAIPFRSLQRPRWGFVPWSLALARPYSNWPLPETIKKWLDSLVYSMDKKVVSNVISTTHLHRMLLRSRQEPESLGIVVGSSGASKDRILCEGLARSLRVDQEAQSDQVRWMSYPGGLKECTPLDSDRPQWLDGTSGVFLASWHTSFSADPTTVARFHFDDGDMTLAEFLSQSRHQSHIAVILSCNISLPSESGDRAFSRIGSAAFGIMEALQANAIVATTNEVTAEVAFVLGRLLSAELASGKDVHTALADSQHRLRRYKVADVKRMLEDLVDDVPEVGQWLKTLNSQDQNSKAFSHAYETEPFYILGLPTATWNSGQSQVATW